MHTLNNLLLSFWGELPLSATILVGGHCHTFLGTCLHPLHSILDTMLAVCHMMFLFVQSPLICVDKCFAFFPSGAAVCAQHLELNPQPHITVSFMEIINMPIQFTYGFAR